MALRWQPTTGFRLSAMKILLSKAKVDYSAGRHQTARGQASLSGKIDMCRWRTLHRGRGFSCPAMRVHQGLGPPKRRWRTCTVDDLPGTGGTRDQTVRRRQRGRRADLCCEPRWMRIGTASVVQDWDLVSSRRS
jgi:hypothetical protein